MPRFLPFTFPFLPFVKIDGGPCGVLASVQAELLKVLLFDKSRGKSGEGKSDDDTASSSSSSSSTSESASASSASASAAVPKGWPAQLVVSPKDADEALFRALAHILTRALKETAAITGDTSSSSSQKYVLIELHPIKSASDASAIGSSTSSSSSSSSSSSESQAGAPAPAPAAPALNKWVSHATQTTVSSEAEAIKYFAEHAALLRSDVGVLSFVLSLLSTVGAEGVRGVMDDVETPLVAKFGHTTLELVNLLLTGCAVSNVFDGNKMLEHAGLLMRGVQKQAEIGFITLLEALRYAKVCLRVFWGSSTLFSPSICLIVNASFPSVHSTYVVF